MDKAVLDAILGNKGHGSLAARLLANGMNVNALRTLDVLRKDEWKQYDTTVVDIARVRLGAVADLVSRGLVYNLPNALGTTRLEWEKISDMEPAEVSMSGITPGQNDRVTYDLTGMPIPIIHKDFNINIRALEASRKTGQALDTTQAALCSRKVSEMTEEILFNGSTITHETGSVLYGYTNAPNRETDSLTDNWVDADGTEIIADVIEMIGKAITNHMYGPYMLYVPYDYFNKLSDDYKAESDKTIMQRLKEIPNIIDVKATSFLGSGENGEVLLVQMTSDVVDMVVGMQPTTVQWETMGGFVVNFKVMSIMVPRIKTDSASQSGIVHYSV